MKDAFIKLHLSVILAGLTGLFGKLVHLHQIPLVFYRVGLAFAILFVILCLRRQLERISLRGMLRVGAVGMVLVLHWIFFFGSIKASNVSVGVVCYSLVGFFTSLLEPWVMHTRYSVRDILLSLVTVAGIVLIFNFDSHYRYGIVLGVISSLFASLFTILNKKVVDDDGYKPTTMLLYEMAGGFLTLVIIVVMGMTGGEVNTLRPTVPDFLWLLFLASFCTIGLQLLQIEALKKLSAFTVNLTYNLEPIYTIIIALTVFHEARQLSAAFFVGLVLIILSVAVKTLLVLHYKSKGEIARS